jgi:hypothetical protein
MWSSWVKEKGTTLVMYIVKLKDGPKRVKKSSQWSRKGFWNGMMEGEKIESYKKEFSELKCFSSLKILASPFIWRDSWSFLSFFSFSILSLPLFLSFILCSVSWGHGCFDDIRGEKLLFQQLIFKRNGVDWLSVDIDGGRIFWNGVMHGNMAKPWSWRWGLWIYRWWTHILEWRYACQYF